MQTQITSKEFLAILRSHKDYLDVHRDEVGRLNRAFHVSNFLREQRKIWDINPLEVIGKLPSEIRLEVTTNIDHVLDLSRLAGILARDLEDWGEDDTWPARLLEREIERYDEIVENIPRWLLSEFTITDFDYMAPIRNEVHLLGLPLEFEKTEEAIKPQVQVQPDAGLARYPLPKPKMSEEDCVHPLPQRLSVPDGEGGTYRVCGVCNKTVGVG